LARFIAHKLNQKLSVRYVLNPIIEELKYCKHTDVESWSVFYNKILPHRRSTYLLCYRIKFIWFNLFCILVSHDKWFCCLGYLKESLWFMYDLFLTFRWLSCVSFSSNLIRSYFKQRTIFTALSCNFDLHQMYQLLVNFYLSFCTSLVIGKSLLVACISSSFFFNSFNIWSGLVSFSSNINNFNSSLGVLILSIKKTYTSYYWKLNYKFHFLRDNPINNVKSRISFVKPNWELQGFKIQCVGRFSRRQRASSYWISIGTVPLNTLSRPIDYGLYSIPLINSAATVKVWLHKATELRSYELKLI